MYLSFSSIVFLFQIGLFCLTPLVFNLAHLSPSICFHLAFSNPVTLILCLFFNLLSPHYSPDFLFLLQAAPCTVLSLSVHPRSSILPLSCFWSQSVTAGRNQRHDTQTLAPLFTLQSLGYRCSNTTCWQQRLPPHNEPVPPNTGLPWQQGGTSRFDVKKLKFMSDATLHFACSVNLWREVPEVFSLSPHWAYTSCSLEQQSISFCHSWATESAHLVTSEKFSRCSGRQLWLWWELRA